MKKKWILALASAALLSACTDPNEYQLVWEETFDSASLDTSVWNFEDNARGGGNSEMQYYSPKNATLERHPSGVNCLVLNAIVENYKGRPATSARINTQDKMTLQYGKIEARIAFPKTENGLWPAFWMLGNNLATDLGDNDDIDLLKDSLEKVGRVVWPKCGEIDMVEMGHAKSIERGVQDRMMNGACHWGPDFNNGAYPNYGHAIVSDYPIQGDFHLFTTYWTPDSIKMYLDEDKYPEAEPYFVLPIAADSTSQNDIKHASHYFHHPFYMVMNLSVGGFFTGLPGPNKYSDTISADFENFVKIRETALKNDTAKMYIDYIRIYQREVDGGSFYLKK